jgi:hypothetical protein
VGAKLACGFAEDSMLESLQEASGNIWQDCHQLFGWRSLVVLVGWNTLGTIGLGGPKPCQGGDMVCARGPLDTVLAE